MHGAEAELLVGRRRVGGGGQGGDLVAGAVDVAMLCPHDEGGGSHSYTPFAYAH